jgi:acetoin utilization deacetylase AcuC-like enzyme
MGFCIFNNVAAAVAHALEADGVRRVLVVDWDVHFGNGTEEIFRGDDRVLVFSAHRYPFYPFTGGADRVYDGRSVNAPLPKGFGDASVGYAFVSLLAPVARSFGPDLVVVSAGYDAHRDDPLGGCAVSDDGFTLLSRFVAALAAELCEGRWLAVLEGGYDLGATARSALRTIEVMLEHDRAPVSFGQADALVRGIVSRAKSAIRRTDFGRTIDWGPSGHA